MLKRTTTLALALMVTLALGAFAGQASGEAAAMQAAAEICPLPGVQDPAPAELDLDDPATDFQPKIRICEDDETIQHCGSLDCTCLFISNTYRCFC